ncbi:MAG: ATP-binding protein [Rhodospirillales bacterium]|nr:ATP-binding protein [Rhodospirillales bacterium]
MTDTPTITKKIDDVLIMTKSYLEALNELEGLYQFRLADPDNGRAIAVTGLSRTGKTKWALSAIEKFEDKGRPEILYVQVPANPSFKAVATEILKEMKDPFAHKSKANTSQITDRVANLFKDKGYTFIVLDEAHHIAPMGKNRIVWEAAEWLKSLMNKGVFLILVGLPDVEEIVTGNPQLQNRVVGHAQMKVSEFETKLGRNLVRKLLTEYDAILTDPECGFPKPSNLIDLADRLTTASSGFLGRLSTLIQRAVYFAAVDRNAKYVDMVHLEKAFDSVNLAQGWGTSNPFRIKKRAA